MIVLTFVHLFMHELLPLNINFYVKKKEINTTFCLISFNLYIYKTAFVYKSLRSANQFS